MVKAQRALLLVATLIVLAMGLFPPWLITARGESRVVTASEGYHFIARHLPVEGMNFALEFRIDIVRLGVQWATVILATVGLLLALRPIKRREF